MAHRDGWPKSTRAQLQLLDDVANQDIEMQPVANDGIYIVLDTNILLEHMQILKHLVEDVAFARAPITVICPGIVLNELDRQKNDPGLGRRARNATDWMLREVTRKGSSQPVVRGQSQRETCKPAKNWKARDKNEVWSNNDDLIADCCKYFDSKAVAVLYTCDKNLCLRCNQEGLRFISPPPPHEYTSLDLVKHLRGVLPDYGMYLDRMIQNYDRVKRDHRKQDDGMIVDGEIQVPQASLVHQEVVERFTPLLRALVQRAGGAELTNLRKAANSVSKHAPQWQRNIAPVDEWGVGECLEYLQHKKEIVFTKPDPPLERFMRKPYSGKGALSGAEWTSSAWKAAVASLRQIGETWKDSGLLEHVDLLDEYVKLEYQ